MIFVRLFVVLLYLVFFNVKMAAVSLRQGLSGPQC